MPDPERKLLCPECEKEVSAEVEFCPSCQFPLATWLLRKRLTAAEKKEAERTEVEVQRKAKEEGQIKPKRFLEHI